VESRYEDEDALYHAAKKKRPDIDRLAFNRALDCVFPSGLLSSADDEDLRQLLDNLPDAVPAKLEPAAKHSVGSPSPRDRNTIEASDALGARARTIAWEDQKLLKIVGDTRLALFGTAEIPFPNDAAAACDWITVNAIPRFELPIMPSQYGDDDEVGSEVFRPPRLFDPDNLHLVDEPAVLWYQGQDGVAWATRFYKDSPVRRIYERSKQIADLFQVAQESAVAYVLTGELPIPSVLEVKEVPDVLPGSLYNIWTEGILPEDHLRGRAYVVITVRHPDVEPDEVAKAYAEARKRLWGTGRSRLQARDVALVEFVRQNKRAPVWSQLQTQWNQGNPTDSAFVSPDDMANSYRRAAAAVTREKQGRAHGPITERDRQLLRFVKLQAWGYGWENLLKKWNRLHSGWVFDSPDTIRNAYRRAYRRIFPPDRSE